ncbi:MAG: hypothetical protein AAB131_14745 [Actinomycetota bacterium]|nr:MAG: hypothetical protein FD127_1199 [Acidimicrobiaceae bacterium]
MSDRTRSTWFVAGTMIGLTLVPVLIVVGVLVGARGPDPSDARVPATTARSEVPSGQQPATAPIDSTTAMVQQHQAMMDQMRASLSPAMADLMNRDPMWQMMRSGAFIALLEEHEQDIDRMLGRGG